ncbi:MAG: glycosyltransferase family 39 protein [Actinomycetota bacterium]|nr:glycosyltransferase family 39 protein [Actinomycetota bacterium]
MRPIVRPRDEYDVTDAGEAVGAGGRAPRPSTSVAGAAAVGLVVALGLVLRFVTTSDLWLDEALTVNIADLPLGEIGDALRRDGHPPLYYWLLHGWMELFGTGDVAVRALSGVFAVLALPVAWLAGRHLGGRSVAWTALVLLAANPFAIRYATEARMYSLVVLLVLVGLVAIGRALDAPRPGRLALVAAVAGALVLTQYWAFYLLVATVGVLALRGWRGTGRGAARRVVLAVAVGCLAFLPWLGGFAYQLDHTGTPWAKGTRLVDASLKTVGDWGGGSLAPMRALGLAIIVLALVASVAALRRVRSSLTTDPEVLAVAFVASVTMALGIGVGFVTASAFASRYTAVAFPLVVLLASVGLGAVTRSGLRTAAMVGLVALGLLGLQRNVVVNRTQGGEIAAAIRDEGEPGDVVAYCPDQLGPSVSRHLGPSFVQTTFPAGAAPAFVDWVDYAERNEAGDPDAFAEEVLRRAGPGRDIWLVWASNYRTLDKKCEALADELTSDGRKAVEVVQRDQDIRERQNLIRYPAP